MWGDGVNPIAFSSQRLSESTSHELWDSSGTPKEDLLHPRHEIKSMDHSEATRSILLKCWHRAVHAASQMTVIDAASVVKGRQTETFPPNDASTQPTRTGIDTSEANDNDDDDSVSESSSASSIVLQSHPEYRPEESPQHDAALRPTSIDNSQDFPDAEFSSERARSFCQSLGIALSDTNENANEFCCPVCQADMGSFESLELHYYGKPTARGCSWIKIRRCREALLNKALMSEVSLQARQIAELIAMRSVDSIKAIRGLPRKKSEPAYKADMFRPSFSWDQVHNILRDVVGSRQPHDEKVAQSNLSDTLDVRLSVTNDKKEATTLPPMHLNLHTFEATSNRLQERYTKIPR